MKTGIRVISLIAAALFLCPPAMDARKTGYRLKTEKPDKASQETEKMSKGSFMVASQCSDCNNGYDIKGVGFSGYDKPLKSSKETFFITNRTDRTMSGVTLYIDYRTPDGRQLDKRFVRLSCLIPAGETRSVDIDSWDKNKNFYYYKGTVPAKGGNPYAVIFDPVCYYLKF